MIIGASTVSRLAKDASGLMDRNYKQKKFPSLNYFLIHSSGPDAQTAASESDKQNPDDDHAPTSPRL